MVKEICETSHAVVTEGTVTVSDGVTLKIYDFQPEEYDPSAPVLVFVAGWVSLIKGWTSVLREIIPGFRVVYVETREKQSARLPTGNYPAFTIDRMAKDLEEVIREKIPEETPFYIAGSSLGSTITLHYLGQAGYRQPKESILISPIGEVEFPLWAKFIISWFPPSAYIIVKHLVIWYLTRVKVDYKKEPEQAEKYRGTVSAAEPKRLQANARALYDYSIWDKLPMIPSRVRIVGAQTDKLHGLEPLERMVSLIPDAEMEIMAGNKETHSDKAGRLIFSVMAAGQA